MNKISHDNQNKLILTIKLGLKVLILSPLKWMKLTILSVGWIKSNDFRPPQYIRHHHHYCRGGGATTITAAAQRPREREEEKERGGCHGCDGRRKRRGKGWLPVTIGEEEEAGGRVLLEGEEERRTSVFPSQTKISSGRRTGPRLCAAYPIMLSRTTAQTVWQVNRNRERINPLYPIPEQGCKWVWLAHDPIQTT